MNLNIRILRAFNFCNDFILYAPVAILYFTRVSGSFALGMSIFSIAMFSSAIFEIPTGIFSDRIGRKRTVTLGAISYVFCTIFYAIGYSYIFLVAGAIFEGLGRSFFSGNNDALLYDTLLEERKENRFHEYLGNVGSMFQLALAVSALSGSFLAGVSFSLVVWLSVIPQIVCVLLSLKLKEPKVHGKKNTGNIYSHLSIAIKEFKRNKKLRLLSLSDILRYGVGEAYFYFNSTFIATLWPIWAIGLAKTLSYAGGALSFRFSGKVIDKFGAEKLLVTTSIYNRFINIVAILFPSILSPLLMSTPSLVYGISSVSTAKLLQKEYTKEQRATMDSLNSLGGSTFFAFFSIGLGLIADKFGIVSAMLLAQICALPTIFVYYRLIHWKE